jgi:hypothetical protein
MSFKGQRPGSNYVEELPTRNPGGTMLSKFHPGNPKVEFAGQTGFVPG